MRGRWYGVPFHDFRLKKWLISLEVDDPCAVYDKTKDKEIEIEIKQHREIRGSDANKYFWVLIKKIAQEMNLDDLDVHDRMLADHIHYIYKGDAYEWMSGDFTPNKYGFVKFINEKNNFEYWKETNIVVKLAKPDGGYYMANGMPKTSKVFFHVKGSHQMDTKEMSGLIDSVVEEAKALGIETLTPKELERMKAAWTAS